MMTRRDDILPGYRGHVDAVEPVLSGWVNEAARPNRPVRLFLGIDRAQPIPVIADRPRADVAVAGLGGPNCGFSLVLPAHFLDGAEHELGFILPDGRRLNLPGRPANVALGPVRGDLIPADAASVSAVADLLRRTNFESGFDPDLIAIEHAAAFNALTGPDQGFLFYARVAARLVGYGRLERGRGDAGALEVVALTVLEAYRRKGLGEALLRAVLRAAVEEGSLREVWLSVRPENTPATSLYDKLGFVRDANHPQASWANPCEMTMVWLPCGHP